MKISLLFILAAQLVLVSTASAEEATKSIPFDQLGAEAGKDYKGEGLTITSSDGGANLRCDFQKLRGTLTSEGLWLESVGQNTPGVPFRVVAQSFGRNVLQSLPTAGEVEATLSLARFVRPGVVEEYSVSVDGVRQDFLVTEKPGGSGPLRVELSVDGAKAETAIGGANLILDGTVRKLAYSRLNVTDATGKALAAQIDVLSENRLAIMVADATATYPVRIDPTFSDADWLSMGGIGGTSGVNSNVMAIVRSGTDLYIGGDFNTSLNNVSIARIAKWDGTNWSPLGTGIGGGGTVHALAVDGVGNVYAGGNFTVAGGVPANRIAKWNGAIWSALGSGMDGGGNPTVRALALDASGNLYAGGDFTSAGGVSTRIAKWNGSNWSSVGSGVGGYVYALAFDTSGNLYAGGNISKGVLKWNGTSWSALGTGLSSSGNFYVLALAFDSTGNLYAGGAFTMAGGIPANHIAKWNGAVWSALGSGMGGLPYTEASVRSLVVDGPGNVYAAGYFTIAGGLPANHIAKWNGSTWSTLDSGMTSLAALAVDSSGTLYAGGSFATAGGNSAGNIASWNGSSWSALGIRNRGGYVRALAHDGSGNIYTGGSFASAGGLPVNNIAKWDGSVWSALGTGMNDSVAALAVDTSGNLYAGGDFTTAGGIAVKYFAKWNGSVWAASGAGMNGNVSVMAADSSGNLYVGGSFSTAGGVSALRIAKWNGMAWSALGTGIEGGVNALALDSSGNLYVGGFFTTAGGIAANHIAKWNGTTWSALGAGISTGSGGYGPWVNALASDASGNLYVGGLFYTAGGVSANNIAKWNGTTWAALGTGMHGGQYHSGELQSMAVDSAGSLYVGGQFIQAGGVNATCIAKWNGTAWSALGQGMYQGWTTWLHPTVAAMVIDTSGNLHAGGGFDYAGGKVTASLAKAILTPAPTNLGLSSYILAENNIPGAVIGTLSATDPDVGATHIFSLVPGVGSTDNASFLITGTSLKINITTDYEIRNSYVIRLRATDSAGLFFETTVTIRISNTNDLPTDLAISSTVLVDNNDPNAIIANLAATDSDIGDTHTFTLVSGVGSSDNSSFTILGNVLKINISTNYTTKNSYTLRLRATDSGGLFFEEAIIITVIDGVVFTDWTANAGLTGPDAALTATPFNDGLSNILKYAFNMNAAGPDVRVLTTGGTSGLPQIAVDSSGAEPVLRVAFLRRMGSGLIYTPQRSDTLGTFVAMTGTQTVTSIDAQWERVSVEEPAPPSTAPSAFARVQVSLP